MFQNANQSQVQFHVIWLTFQILQLQVTSQSKWKNLLIFISDYTATTNSWSTSMPSPYAYEILSHARAVFSLIICCHQILQIGTTWITANKTLSNGPNQIFTRTSSTFGSITRNQSPTTHLSNHKKNISQSDQLNLLLHLRTQHQSQLVRRALFIQEHHVLNHQHQITIVRGVLILLVTVQIILDDAI